MHVGRRGGGWKGGKGRKGWISGKGGNQRGKDALVDRPGTE